MKDKNILANQSIIFNHQKLSEGTLRCWFRGHETSKPFNKATGIPPSTGPRRLFSSLRAESILAMKDTGADRKLSFSKDTCSWMCFYPSVLWLSTSVIQQQPHCHSNLSSHPTLPPCRSLWELCERMRRDDRGPGAVTPALQQWRRREVRQWYLSQSRNSPMGKR